MAVLIQIRNAHKSYGDQVLLDGAEASIVEDAKLGFVGRNGAGKSTLLRVILGEEELDSGEVVKHPNLRVGYLRQHDPFQANESALEFLIRDSQQPEWKCGEVAGKFELKGSYLTGPVAELSGGWQTRVKLAALLLHEPNLLLLDEPTNFLDLRTQLLLEHFLRIIPRPKSETIVCLMRAVICRRERRLVFRLTSSFVFVFGWQLVWLRSLSTEPPTSLMSLHP